MDRSAAGRLDPLLAERAKLRTWLPFVLLLLVWGVLATPWGIIEDDFDTTGELDDFGWRLELGRNLTDVELRGIDLENSTGGDIVNLDETFSAGYRDLDLPPTQDDDGGGEDQADLLAETAETIERRTGWLLPLTLILIAGAIDRMRPGGLTDRWPAVMEGLMAASALVLVIAAAGAIVATSGLGDGAIELLDLEDEMSDAALFDGWSGELQIDGQVYDETATWRPGLMWWLLLLTVAVGLPLVILHALELWPDAAAATSTRAFPSGREDFAWDEGAERVDLGTAELAPRGVSIALAHAVPALALLALVAVIFALMAPWFSVDQTWHLDTDGDTLREPTTFEWDVDPWEVEHLNNTLLAEANRTQAEYEREDLSFDEDTDLDLVTDVIDGVRWPLIVAMLALLTVLIMWQPWWPVLANVGGDLRGWMVLGLGVTFLVLLWGVGDIEGDLAAAWADDSFSVAPGDEVVFFASETANVSIAGHEFGTGAVANGSGEDPVVVETQWSAGWGLGAANVAQTFAGIGLLLALGSAATWPRQQDSEMVPQSWLEDDPWVAWRDWDAPVAWGVAGFLVLLLLLGGGAAGLLFGGGGNALPERTWRVTFPSDNGGDQETTTVNDGDSTEFRLGSAGLGLENVTLAQIQVQCQEGTPGFPLDAGDSMDVTITPPPSFVPSEAPTWTFTDVNCNAGFINQVYEAAHAPQSNFVNVRAEDADAAVAPFVNHSAEGNWTVEVSITTAAGIASNDPSASVTIRIDLQSRTPQAQRVLAQ